MEVSKRVAPFLPIVALLGNMSASAQHRPEMEVIAKAMREVLPAEANCAWNDYGAPVCKYTVTPQGELHVLTLFVDMLLEPGTIKAELNSRPGGSPDGRKLGDMWFGFLSKIGFSDSVVRGCLAELDRTQKGRAEVLVGKKIGTCVSTFNDFDKRIIVGFEIRANNRF
jgi:hypothetical protein